MTKEEALRILDTIPTIGDQVDALEMAIEALEQPERKKGRWIHEKINSYTSRIYCSECGNAAPSRCVSDDYYGVHMHGEINKTKFCPNCGADMRGEQDGTT